MLDFSCGIAQGEGGVLIPLTPRSPLCPSADFPEPQLNYGPGAVVLLRMNGSNSDASCRAAAVRAALPPNGLFAGHDWRVSATPFELGPELAAELASLGRVLVQFYRAVNLLYRRSVEGQAPAWVATLLDQGKPAELIALQRDAAFKGELPRVIRPDVLLTEAGIALSE